MPRPLLDDLVRQLQQEPQYRDCDLVREKVEESGRIIEMSFSSETREVERWFGIEILDHGPEAVDLSFLNDDGPLLREHDPKDHVGSIRRAWIGDDRRGRARAEFGQTQRAIEAMQEVASGMKKHVSVGYQVLAMVLEETHEDGPDVYRVTRWRPMEISLVAVPADRSVAVGRSAGVPPAPGPGQEPVPQPKEQLMTEPIQAVDVAAERAAGAKAERERIANIQFIAGQLGVAEDRVRKALDGNISAEEFARDAIKDFKGPSPIRQIDPNEGAVGLSTKEQERFSLLRLVNYLGNQGDRSAQEAAAFELEVCRAARLTSGRTPKGFVIPPDAFGPMKRDMTAGTSGQGSQLVGTTHMASEFIGLLYNRTQCVKAGARLMTGLRGNVAIPKVTAGMTGAWVAENNAPSETAYLTTAQLALSPKMGRGYIDLSRTLIIQSDPAAESMARDELFNSLGVLLDASALHGLGSSNQPRGIAATTGIGSVAGGTNGAAPTWANITALEREVAVDNADMGKLAYMTNPLVRDKLKNTLKIATLGSTFVWPETIGVNGEAMLNGYRAFVTNQVASTLEKGTSGAVCSAIFFGDFDNLVIALWGGIDILVDPFTGSAAGTVRVVGYIDADIGVRRPQGFSAMLDALTS